MDLFNLDIANSALGRQRLATRVRIDIKRYKNRPIYDKYNILHRYVQYKQNI